MGHQLEALATRQQLSHRSTNLAAGVHLLLGYAGRVATAGISIAAQLPADGRRGSGDQAGNPTQAEALGMTDLNGGALFNAEFGIRHRGSTVPERSGVALSFCRRPLYAACMGRFGVLIDFLSHAETNNLRKVIDMKCLAKAYAHGINHQPFSGNPFSPSTQISEHELNAEYVKVLQQAHLPIPKL
jgi:hypothetical protein